MNEAIYEALILILKTIKPKPLGSINENYYKALNKYIDSTIKMLEKEKEFNYGKKI